MTTPDVQVTWQDYLAVAARRKAFFLVPLIASLIVGFFVLVFSPRIYQAQSLILVQNEKLINPLIQGLAMPTAITERLNTLREEILSWENLTKLIATHELGGKLRKNDPVALDGLVRKLREDIGVKLRGQSLIEVIYEGRDPAKVQEVVNALTDIVIERDAAIQEAEAGDAVSFIEAELNVYRKKLEDSEQKLREFKELYMTQMPVVTALNNQLKDLEVQLSNLLIDNTEAHPRVIQVRQQIEEVRKHRDDEVQRLVAKGVLKDKDPELYKEFLAQLTAPNQAAAATANAQMNAAMRKAQEAVAGVVAGLDAPAMDAPPTTSQISMGPQGTTTIQVNDAAATSLTLAPRQQQELARLTRDYSVNETIYRTLLEKLERAKITGRLGEDKEGGKFAVIERARFPLKPIRPQPVLVWLVALFLGVSLGIGAVIVAEYLDQSIQAAPEAAELLGVPVLGSISTILTEADVTRQRQRRKSWFSYKDQSHRVSGFLRTYLVHPVWSRVDKALVKWGL